MEPAVRNPCLQQKIIIIRTRNKSIKSIAEGGGRNYSIQDTHRNRVFDNESTKFYP